MSGNLADSLFRCQRLLVDGVDKTVEAKMARGVQHDDHKQCRGVDGGHRTADGHAWRQRRSHAGRAGSAACGVSWG
eukprot:2971101-Rhodomonas_salina.2